MNKESPNYANAELIQAIAYGLDHDLFEDRLGMTALRNVENGVAGDFERGIVMGRVRNYQIREARGRTVPFRRPRLPLGEIVVGCSFDGQPVTLAKQALNAGTILVGNTGSTKTNLIMLILMQLCLVLKGCWAVDLYKRSLRFLRPIIRRASLRALGYPVNLVILRSQDWRINPLHPDGQDPRGYLPVVTDLLVRVLGLPSRARMILVSLIDEMYRDFGVYDGSTRFPCLFDLHVRCRKATGLNSPAKDAIVDRLGTILTALGPKVAAYRIGWRPSSLANKHLVAELHGTTEIAKNLLLYYPSFSLLHSRAAEGLPNGPMDLWICFDDAQRLMGSRLDSNGGDVLPLEELGGVIRGAGRVGLCYTAQTLEHLPSGIEANTPTKFMGRLGLDSDHQTLGRNMAMTAEQIAWAKHHLGPGIFIAQFGDTAWRYPFPFRVPQIKIPHGEEVTDEEVLESHRELDNLPTVHASEYADWQMWPVVTLNGTTKTGNTDAGKRPPTSLAQTGDPSPSSGAAPPVGPAPAGGSAPSDGPVLTDADVRFLRAVVENPGQPSSIYPKLAGLNTANATASRRELVQLNLIRIAILAKSGRGRPAQVLIATPAGQAVIGPKAIGAIGCAANSSTTNS